MKNFIMFMKTIFDDYHVSGMLERDNVIENIAMILEDQNLDQFKKHLLSSNNDISNDYFYLTFDPADTNKVTIGIQDSSDDNNDEVTIDKNMLMNLMTQWQEFVAQKAERIILEQGHDNTFKLVAEYEKISNEEFIILAKERHLKDPTNVSYQYARIESRFLYFLSRIFVILNDALTADLKKWLLDNDSAIFCKETIDFSLEKNKTFRSKILHKITIELTWQPFSEPNNIEIDQHVLISLIDKWEEYKAQNAEEIILFREGNHTKIEAKFNKVMI